MPGCYVDNAYNRRIGRVGMYRGSMPVSRGSPGFFSSPKTYVDNAFNRRVGRVGLQHGTAMISKSSYSSYESFSPKILQCIDNAFNSKSSSLSENVSPKTDVDNARSLNVGREGLEHRKTVISKSSTSSENISPKTNVENANNRSVGRVGLEHGKAMVSKSSKSLEDSSSKTNVDNGNNRSDGRAELAHGKAVVSKSTTSSKNSSPKTNVDNANNRSIGRAGLQHGKAVVSKSPTSSEHVSHKTYVDNANNRSVGRVGLKHGTPMISKSTTTSSSSSSSSSAAESVSPKSYIDNTYDENVERVVLDHGTTVMSKGGSKSPDVKVNVNYTINRAFRQVNIPLGSLTVSSKKSRTKSESNIKRKEGNIMINVNVFEEGCYDRQKKEMDQEILQEDSVYTEEASEEPDDFIPVQQVQLRQEESQKSKTSSTTVFQNGDMDLQNTQDSVCTEETSEEPATEETGEEPAKLVPMEQVQLRQEESQKSKTSMTSVQEEGMDLENNPQEDVVYTEEASEQLLDLINIMDQVQLRQEESPKSKTPLTSVIQKEGTDLENAQKDCVYTEESSKQLLDFNSIMEPVKLWQEESQNKREPLTSLNLLKSSLGKIIEFDELDMRKKIGHGGFGDIHCAKWKDTVVAVKKLRVQRVSQKRLQEFTSEVKVFCTLNHPNIVNFIGACCVTPNIAIVMELMEYCLFQLLHISVQEDSPVTVEDKLSMIVQISRGLAYLHNKGIAHCDIKSRNVLIDSRKGGYLAKITDFGLSMMKCDLDTSQQVQKIGTPRYSAPEVLRGELLNRKAMMRADVYSLGLVVFEIISEKEPFDSLNAQQLDRCVGHGDETPVFGTDVDENLEEDVKECWRRNPFHRPSASSFRDSVELWFTIYM